MLHIVNKSPALTRSLESCVRLSRPGQSLLLIEDGIYAATASAGWAEKMKHLQVYVLQPDVAARGMTGKLVDGLTAVDYAGFVDLVAAHSTNQSWL